jgi:hypothetical protein
VFCQCRHWFEPAGKHDALRCSGDISASSVFTASIIASVGAPSGWRANRPGIGWPLVLMPRNGSLNIASHLPNSSRARGLFVRVSACARAVGPAIFDSCSFGTNG